MLPYYQTDKDYNSFIRMSDSELFVFREWTIFRGFACIDPQLFLIFSLNTLGRLKEIRLRFSLARILQINPNEDVTR